MTTVLDDYPTLVRKLEKLRRKTDQAAGAYEAEMARIRQRWDVATIEEAEELLKEKLRKEIATFSRYNRVRDKFDAKFGKLLAEVEL